MKRLIRAFNAATETARTVIAGFNEAIGGDGEWFRLAPRGEHPNEVGMQLVDDAAARAMVAGFNSISRRLQHPRGLPIHVGHPTDPKWRRDNPEIYARYPHPIGRIVAMEERDGEAWYRPAFNARHLDLVKGEAAAFESQSPEWGMAEVPGRPGVFRPVVLDGIGLTNFPQIRGTNIGLNEAEQTKQTTERNTMPDWLKRLLGYSAESTPTEADLQARLQTALNERTTAQADVTRLTTELATVTTRVTEVEGNLTTATNERTTAENARKAERAARAELVVTTAVNEGRVVEADRAQWVTKLTDAADFTATAGELATLKQTVNTQSQVAGLGSRKGEGEEVVAVSAINEAVQSYAKEHGLDLKTSDGHHAAYIGAKAKNPALFEPKKS